MTFLSRLKDFVSNYYTKGLDENGFKFISEVNGPGMGARMDFKKDDIIIQFVNDRDQYFVSISNQKKAKEKWDLDLIMAYFYLNGLCVFDLNNVSRKEIMLKVCNWENYKQLARFLFDNINQILELTSKFDSNPFYQDLKKLIKERGKYIWE